MFKTLQSALFVSIVGIVVISLIIFALFATPRIKDTAVNQIDNELFNQMTLVADDFSRLLRNGAGISEMQAGVKRAARLSKSRVTVIAKNGMVLGDSATPLAKLADLENHLDRPEIQKALSLGKGESLRHSTTIDKDLIYSAVPLRDKKGAVIGFLRFSVPSTYATELVMKIYKSMLVALVIAILISATISMFFSRSFAKPIVRLAGISRKIERGEFPQVVVRRSRFEVGKLEEAVEQMSQRLSDTFQKLSAQRSQISAVLSSMSEGVLAADQNGKIILANPAIERMFGIIEPEIVGKTVREGIRNNKIADLVEESLASNGPVEKEIDIVIPVESTFAAHAGPIRTNEGEILGVVCVLHNITELKKLEKYRSEFVANVSHELKTPLTAIRNYVETLTGGAIDDKKHNLEFLNKIDKHAVNLSVLIDDILVTSRLESKKEQGPFGRIDLAMVVSRAVEMIYERAKKKGISLERKYEEGRYFVSGIEEHVYRAVLNLLDNAVNYTGEGGTIEIVCAKKEDKIEIVVADTGIGVPPEHLSRIFERFYRVDKARSRELGGTGLGLSIVKHVMNIHNGTVSVESEVDKGSKFTLIFPA
ncbi:MAG: cell wall metabolism sensor histidine kinase WalK [Candidatus Margulisbacteria bacterium]|nr:cell wall metabolism sensor histidine kinase WalK [Candidatus Margulisiibacteriota bacterium]